MIAKSEKEIMKHWTKGVETPLVSISCVTYNHELFISQAIDGFLIQETTFPFEILIHDDASSDKTAEIIRTYEKKYPTLIKPIYQTENQYSKGSDIVSFNFSRAKGEYIALCEGDDFWTDKEKLEFQINKMKENPNCHISFHPAIILNDQTVTERIVARHLEHDTVFDMKMVIKGKGGFCPTASLIIKKVAVEKLPIFFSTAPVIDYFLQMFGSLYGGALYIDKVMSVYRIHPTGVWTSIESDFEKRKKFAIEMTTTVQEMDAFLKFKFHEEFVFFIASTYLGIMKNKRFLIQDRINLYDICKSYLSINEQIKQQQLFIDEQMRMIKNKEKSFNQLQLELKEKNDNLKTILDSIKNITQFSIISSPIQKYRAYKLLIKNIIK